MIPWRNKLSSSSSLQSENIEKKEDEIARLVKSLVEAVELTIEDRDAAVKVLSRDGGGYRTGR